MQGRFITGRAPVGMSYHNIETPVGLQFSLPPPILQHYTARLQECRFNHKLTPQVFNEILHNKEFFRDVNGFYDKAFGDLLREVAWKWWWACAKDILHGTVNKNSNSSSTYSNSNNNNNNEGNPLLANAHPNTTNIMSTISSNNEDISGTNDETRVTLPTGDANNNNNNENGYKDLRSVLLLMTIMGAPYRVVRSEGYPTVTCTSRLMLCRDPSIVYLGLLINLSRSFPQDKVLDGVAVLHIIAHGWGSSPTFEDVVKCCLRARQRARRRVTVNNNNNNNNNISQNQEKQQQQQQQQQAHSKGTTTIITEESELNVEEAESDAALLQLPNLVKNPLQIVPERLLRNSISDDPAYPLDLVQIGQVVLDSMAEAAGNPEKLLWWCRCRLLCLRLLSLSERDAVLSGPASDFFRSVWRTERLFSTILDDIEIDDKSIINNNFNYNYNCSSSTSGGTSNEKKEVWKQEEKTITENSVPNAATLVGMMADVVQTWHFAVLGGGVLHSIISNYDALNPLDTISRIVPGHRSFQLNSHQCLEEQWQYRLLTDYHSTHMAIFLPSNPSYATMLPAMIAQLTEMLRSHPRYSPVLLMLSLALARENTNTSVALNYGIVPAIVTVMRTYMEDKKERDNISDNEKGLRYGWPYEAVNVLSWCFTVMERLVTISTHESINPIVFLLSPKQDDDYELCKHICDTILHPGGHPVLIAASFRFFAACIHHNVRDVVPALQQRGVLQTVLEIAEGASLLKSYNQPITQAQPPATPEISNITNNIDNQDIVEGQITPISNTSNSRIQETHNLLINEEDTAIQGRTISNHNSIPFSYMESRVVDPMAYYEEAIPIINFCSILQAFAVHNGTHENLNKPKLMWNFVWSLIVPYSTVESETKITNLTTVSGIQSPYITTRDAAAVGKDLLSLIRTLPKLQDCFFAALMESLVTLVAESKLSNAPKQVALSLWNIIACLSAAEFRKLNQRTSNRRQRNRHADAANTVTDTINQKLIQFKSILASAVSAVLNLPLSTSNAMSNSSVLRSFMCDLPPPVFDCVSREIVKFAEEAAVSASQGNLSEDRATSLQLLTSAFARFQSAPSSVLISNFRPELANALFDTYVALEVAAIEENATTNQNISESSQEILTNSTTVIGGGGGGGGTTSLTPPVRRARGVLERSISDAEMEWVIPAGANPYEDIMFFSHDDRLLTGTGGTTPLHAGFPSSTMMMLTTTSSSAAAAPGEINSVESISAIERFRQCIARRLISNMDRNYPSLASVRMQQRGILPSQSQHNMLPVNTYHLLRGAANTLKNIRRTIEEAVYKKRNEMANENLNNVQTNLVIRQILRTSALEALNMSELRGVEIRLRSAEALLSTVWRTSSNGENDFNILFSEIAACLQSITENILPLKNEPLLSSSSSQLPTDSTLPNNTSISSSKLSNVTSALSSILEVLLKATPERGPTQRHWVQPLVYFSLITWRDHGLSLNSGMIIALLSRLFDFNTDIFSPEADRSPIASLPFNAAEEENQPSLEMRLNDIDLAVWPDRSINSVNNNNNNNNDTTEVPLTLNVEVSTEEKLAPGSNDSSTTSPNTNNNSSNFKVPIISLSERALQWVLEVASITRFSKGLTDSERIQMRRLCCKVCWIYTSSREPNFNNENISVSGQKKSNSILIQMIRLIFEDPARNYSLLEILAVLLSQEESIPLRGLLVTQTHLPKAIFDCITAEVNRISSELYTNSTQSEEQRRSVKLMLGQLFCFLSACSANTVVEKGIRACAYYRGASFRFCWMGHLCCHPHPSETTLPPRRISSSILKAAQDITTLLTEFGYDDVMEPEKISEEKISGIHTNEIGKGIESTNTNTITKDDENKKEDSTGPRIIGGNNGEVKLSLSSAIGGTSTLPKNLLPICVELVLEYLAEDDTAFELELNKEKELEKQQGNQDNEEYNGNNRNHRNYRKNEKSKQEPHVLETPVVDIAVGLLEKVLEASDASLISHIYHLNDTSKKGFVVRAISRLLRNNISGDSSRVSVLKSLMDQVDHTEWVVYSAMVSAIQNHIKIGDTHILKEKDMQAMCTQYGYPNIRKNQNQRSMNLSNSSISGISEVHRHSIPLNDFIVTLQSVIEKHPKAFCSVFNTSCVVHILTVPNSKSSQNNAVTAVWLAPRKPPRTNMSNVSRTPHRIAVEQVLDMLLQRFSRKEVSPSLVSTVLNHITTLPAVAAIVTAYNVKVSLPESMQTIFVESKLVEEEQTRQQQLETSREKGMLFLTPFLATVLFMETSNLELLEPFLFNVAQKAPSRLVHLLLHALGVILDTIKQPSNINKNDNEENEEVEKVEKSVKITEIGPSSTKMACNLMHVMRLLLATTSRSLVWRLCDEFWQRGALDILYRMVNLHCCSSEHDAAALILCIRRMLLAYSKCSNKNMHHTDEDRPEAENFTGVAGQSTTSVIMSPQPLPASNITIPALYESTLLLDHNDSTQVPPRVQRDTSSRAGDDVFFFNDLVTGQDGRMRIPHEMSLTEVILENGDLLRTGDMIPYFSHDSENNHDDEVDDEDEIDDEDENDEDDDEDEDEDDEDNNTNDDDDENDNDINEDEDDDEDMHIDIVVDNVGRSPRPILREIHAEDISGVNTHGNDINIDNEEGYENDDDDDDDEEVEFPDDIFDEEEEVEFPDDELDDGVFSSDIVPPTMLRRFPLDEMHLMDSEYYSNYATGIVNADAISVGGSLSLMARGLSRRDNDPYRPLSDHLLLPAINDINGWTMVASHENIPVYEMINRHRSEWIGNNYFSHGNERHGIAARLVNICEAINAAVDRQWDDLAVIEPLPRTLRATEVVPPRSPTSQELQSTPQPQPLSFTDNNNNITINTGDGFTATHQNTLPTSPLELGTPIEQLLNPQIEVGGYGTSASGESENNNNNNNNNSFENPVEDADARIRALFAPPQSSSSQQQQQEEETEVITSTGNHAGGATEPGVINSSNTGDTNTTNTNSGAEPAEANISEPAMEEQPWYDRIQPSFIIELPETMRREVLFEHMDYLLFEREREVEGHRTRVFAAFLTQFPSDVQREVIEVEQRWRRVTGNETNVLSDVLATVDPEVRRDILLTCDLHHIENDAELLEEAMRLRELQSMEVHRDEERLQQRQPQQQQTQQQQTQSMQEGPRLTPENIVEVFARTGMAMADVFAEELPWGISRTSLTAEGQQLPERLGGRGRLLPGSDPHTTATGASNNNNNNNNTRSGRPPRGRDRITDALLATGTRTLQSRYAREEKISFPPNRQEGVAGLQATVPRVPSLVLQRLIELIWFANSGSAAFERISASSSQLSVTSQLVHLLDTVCVSTEIATEALRYLLNVPLQVNPYLNTNSLNTFNNKNTSIRSDGSTVAVQVLTTIDKLIECCRAAGLSFTTLPDGVEEGGPLKPIDSPYNTAEQQALEAALFRRLVQLVLRFPSPHVESAFTRIVTKLNTQLKSLENTGGVRSRGPREEENISLSDSVIICPRHPHPLRWDNLFRYPYTDGGCVCDRCEALRRADPATYHCETCRYDICAGCSFVTITAEEEIQRSRRWGYALVTSEGTMQAVLELLKHPNCTSDMSQQIVRFLRRGIKESAHRDSNVIATSINNNNNNNNNSPIAIVERVVIELAKELTAEIHARIKSYRSAFPGKTMSSAESITNTTTLVTTSNNNNNNTEELTNKQWTAQEANAALSHMNLECTTNQTHALFLTYAESHSSEPREVSLMWHASQMYLAEVASILQRLPNRSSVLIPRPVLLLLNGFCQFHMAELRRTSYSASTGAESISSFTIEKTETERFMLDTTHTPSSVSKAAESSLARADQQQQEQEEQQRSRNRHRHYSTDDVGSFSGSVGASDSTRDERSVMPRIVREFVERNKVTINALIQCDPMLLKENFSFLKSEPGFIDFNIRLADFQRHISYTRQGPRISLSISRDQCLRDSFAQLSKLKSFRGPLNVRFRGEEGADAGGLTREWFQLLAEEMVNDGYALFIHSCEGMTYQPNPFSDINHNHLQYFKFAGTVVGMAVAHGVPIDVHFTRAVYRHMTGVQPIFRDLESVDPELYENLNWLLKNDVSDLGLFFTVSCERFGAVQETELIPNGAHTAVTNANKSQYVRLRCEFHMTRQIEQQMIEFLKGFYTVIPRKEIRNFTAQELELVICGMPDIDVEDLRVHTVYEGYTSSSPQIRWFWEVVASMSKEDKANLLQFATGASKVPHGGFSNLEAAGGAPQRFTITKWEDSADLLPQAHTCFNKIDLPEYPSCDELRKKLMLAITFGSRGFSML